MKIRLLLLSLAMVNSLYGAKIIPTPKSDIARNGSFTINSATTLCVDSSLMPLSDYLADYIHFRHVTQQPTSNNAIVLRADTTMASEAYRLLVEPHRIEIVGGSYGGVFNGVQSLLQLLPSHTYTKRVALPVSIACREIDDAPQFAYRGMMIDVARTWIEADDLKRYINILAYHKINKLHIHLTDDEGWRIEIKSHPELTDIGAFRGEGSPVRAVYGKWGERYGGFYTQQQMRDIIAYAALRNIEIIPEIDLPGHSRNIASVHPEIRCSYTPNLDVSNGYDYRSAWCVAKESNYTLLRDILDEVCALFPSQQIHVGGDEVVLDQWQQCPDCSALMTERGMTDPHQLEDLFMARLARMLEANHKRASVWNEATNGGGLSLNSVVYGWQGVKECLAATAAGYQTIVMPSSHFYFDMRQSPREEGHSWAAIFDLSRTYSFDFTEQGFSAAQMANVKGFEGAFWSEAYVSHTPERHDYLDYMTYPRICALSEVAWGKNSGTWESFYTALKDSHYDRMVAMKVHFRLSPPKMEYKGGVFTLSVDDLSHIYYTDDESEPTIHSKRYTSPIATREPYKYRFRSIYHTAQSPIVTHDDAYRTTTPALTVTTSMGESAKIPMSNASTYKTFSRTARACRQGDWILYTFGSPVASRAIELQTGNLQLPKTIVTTGDVLVTYDGTEWVKVAELEKGSATLRLKRAVRAIKVISTCDDNGTEWVTIQPLRIKPIL